MKNNRWPGQISNVLNRIVKTAFKGVTLTIFFMVLGVGLLVIQSQLPSGNNQLAADNQQAEWGSESVNVTEHAGHFQLIPLANACGLGASSCFKCHNGKRAEAPSNAAWHTDHDKVNNSCVGCHSGNPRLLKKTIAHSGLIAKPVSSPDKSCADCHTGSDVSALAGKYHSSVSGGK